MKIQSNIACILGSAVFISQITAEIPLKAIHAENTHNIMRQIIDIPLAEQSFENTFIPLIRLTTEDYANSNTLASLGQADIQELHTLLLKEVFQNRDLYYCLSRYAQKAWNEGSLNPYQIYLIQSFLEKFAAIENNTQAKGSFIYFPGKVQDPTYLDRDINTEELTILNASLVLGNEVLEKPPLLEVDVVYLLEILSVETANALYEKLKNQYAHFYIGIGHSLLGYSQIIDFPNGPFIASKYPIESSQLNEMIFAKQLDVFFKNIGAIWNEHSIILCGGRAEASASVDTNGNASVGGSVSVSKDDDNRTYSAEISGNVTRDDRGNTSAQAEVKGSVSW